MMNLWKRGMLVLCAIHRLYCMHAYFCIFTDVECGEWAKMVAQL